MVLAEATETFGNVLFLIIQAIILVVLGLVFFLINLWIIDIAATLLQLKPEMPDVTYSAFVILSAAILSAASMLGSRRGS